MDEQIDGHGTLVASLKAREEAMVSANVGSETKETFEDIDENEESDESGEEVLGPRPGRPASPEPDFTDIRDPACRPAARAEYRRAIEEFRQTGTVREKEWDEFAHLTNPPGLQVHVYDAHCRALLAVDDWQDEHPAVELPRYELAAVSPAVVVAPEPVALPQLRGVAFDARAPSRLYSYEEDGPLLPLERPDDPPPAADATTEALLNAMIGECHFLMREVAFRSMCQARVLEDRMSWVGASMKLAKTGAKVAKTIGRLRHGPRTRETHHISTITQKVIAAASVDVRGGGG